MSSFLEKILKESLLFESKQVGTLYHFTNFEKIIPILITNKLLPHLKYSSKENLQGVSLSRSKSFIPNGHVKTSVRIALDGNKISNKYKIIPYKEFRNIEENEEFILTNNEGLTNLKNYILSIDIFPENEEDRFWAKKIKYILSRMKKFEIPFHIDDMWLDYINDNPEIFTEKILKENIQQKYIGYHYSSSSLNIGDIIISNQHKGKTYDLVWKFYKDINKSMPYEFGYAYPVQKDLSYKHIYKVTSDFCIKGNLNYSVYFTMDWLSSQDFMRNKTIPLKERLNKRDEFLRTNAELYFTVLEYPEEIELISDSWKIIEIIK